MRELSVVEQRYQAVLAVIGQGETVKDVAARWGVARQTLHRWLARYEAGGLDGLGDGSHRPRGCPHQMPAEVEAAVLEARRRHVSWGPRRIVYELARQGVDPAPSESGVYRCLRRSGLIEPDTRRRRRRDWKRWERGTPMELWQMDTVGGFLLADGSRAKALTGVDDHSRFCVSARLMARERTRPVCDGLLAALARYGIPTQILTDNGKVFTGRFGAHQTEVLFDRICRENGIEHLLTAPRTPTTTGKVERFHKTLREEFDTAQVFSSLRAAQQALSEWVDYYNNERPHQMIGMAPPADRFGNRAQPAAEPTRPADPARGTRPGQHWVARRVASNGVVSVDWQQVSVGKHRAGARCDVLVTDQLLQFWIGDELMTTVPRTRTGEVRKKRASVRREQQ
jgi:transposase InsO family protein